MNYNNGGEVGVGVVSGHFEKPEDWGTRLSLILDCEDGRQME
jgi:hypothetical protein